MGSDSTSSDGASCTRSVHAVVCKPRAQGHKYGMSQEEMIDIDIGGNVVSVPRDAVSALAATAAQRAGVSKRHRDLSLDLGRALQVGHVSLGRPEMRALCAVLEEDQLERFGPEVSELV